MDKKKIEELKKQDKPDSALVASVRREMSMQNRHLNQMIYILRSAGMLVREIDTSFLYN